MRHILEMETGIREERMSFLGTIGGGIKGLVKRTASAGIGGLVLGGGGSTALEASDDITAVIAAITALIGAAGNLLREYYAYKKAMKVVA